MHIQEPKFKITFLGTGTSQGVPVIACPCEVCRSTDPKDNRLRTSIWIQSEDCSIVVDSGPDFRYQMLRAQVKELDALLFTHGHKDHTAGMDDIRAYNYFQNKNMDVYADRQTQAVLKREFSYIFDNLDYPGIPRIDLHDITGSPFTIKGLTIMPVQVLHYRLEVYGFRIGNFTYITDANYISPEEMEKIKGSEVLVLNALRHEKHISHYTLDEAIEVAQEAGAAETYFTHISHQLGLHAAVEKTLPAHMHLAYDGLVLQF